MTPDIHLFVWMILDSLPISQTTPVITHDSWMAPAVHPTCLVTPTACSISWSSRLPDSSGCTSCQLSSCQLGDISHPSGFVFPAHLAGHSINFLDWMRAADVCRVSVHSPNSCQVQDFPSARSPRQFSPIPSTRGEFSWRLFPGRVASPGSLKMRGR